MTDLTLSIVVTRETRRKAEEIFFITPSSMKVSGITHSRDGIPVRIPWSWLPHLCA